MLTRAIRFFLANRLVTVLLAAALAFGGILFSPFDWEIPGLYRDSVPVDAIPDLGENQQIVFTSWEGRSPQDVEDQVTYPLTVALLGIPGVKTIRSHSYFGFSSINVLFRNSIEFYWSRSRILEKLASLPARTLPDEARPALGPDATALGQVFWYTLEGRDPQGKPTGGWDLHDLRAQQDWYVRYALSAVEGVAEVASVGGHVREYQIDVDPDAMRAHGISLDEVYAAVKLANADVGARTIEINRVEYVVRGLGSIQTLADIESSVIKVRGHAPILIKDVAHVTLGPALRRGALDKEGAEVVGGVIVVRYGENPLAVIKRVKRRISEISPGLPRKTLADGTISQLNIVPFYDRTRLIHETLETLNQTLINEILITAIVILVALFYLPSSLLVSGLLPLAVLICFIAMRFFKVDANVVALSGIAIAVGTMVDMGIVLIENVSRRLSLRKEGVSTWETILSATTEVGGAILTATATTIIGFLPVFALEGPEGKLFKPLAYTKSFALVASLLVTLFLLPAFAYWILGRNSKSSSKARGNGPQTFRQALRSPLFLLSLGLGLIILTGYWRPLGLGRTFWTNLFFVALMVSSVLALFALFRRHYVQILAWALVRKKQFLVLPIVLFLLGILAWSGLGREFMPPLDEGSYLYMPTTMPHASIGEALDVLQKLDMAISSLPEVDSVVGKLGRAESPLDPAPISMIEAVVNYKPEFVSDEKGRILRFEFDRKEQVFVRGADDQLIPSRWGRPYRNWRDHVRNPDDIWREITQVARLPGTTSAPKLQPITARLVMLQSGMRAPFGLKIKGPDLETIDRFGLEVEKLFRTLPSIAADSVIADRMIGKPYLEIRIDRNAIARYGIPVQKLQNSIEIAIGGKRITTTIEGRQRYSVRVRYPRELRGDLESLGEILVSASDGTPIPLIQLATIEYVRGPQVIKSEDTFPVGYVLFDKAAQASEVEVVEKASRLLKDRIAEGELKVPAGVSFSFAGTYENQIRSAQKLRLLVPLALLLIFLILYFQFRSTVTTLIIFSSILLAWAGGFVLLWLYGQKWFLGFGFIGVDLRELFHLGPINLSVAVWVGFLALFGIASDDGVIMSTYLDQNFRRKRPQSIEQVRQSVSEAAQRRIRPCLMTTTTTLLALLPILTSSGRGSDIMIPMAIPIFGGMCVAVLATLVVPVLYAAKAEWTLCRVFPSGSDRVRLETEKAP